VLGIWNLQVVDNLRYLTFYSQKYYLLISRIIPTPFFDFYEKIVFGSSQK